MADTPPTQAELDLRRRARRRLVGAVALALLAVVVLPMVFDPEPRPLGDQVEIRIPDQKTPFEPAAMPAPEPAPPAAEAAPAEPAPAPAPPEPAPATRPEAKPAPETKPVPAAKPEARPEPVAKAEAKPAQKPEAKPAAKVAVKPEPKPAAKPEAAQPEAKPEAKPAGAYYLQLGVFSSRANAEQMLAKARAAGFKAAMQEAGKQFRVRVGPIAERAKALDYQAKLKAKGVDNVLVEP